MYLLLQINERFIQSKQYDFPLKIGFILHS